MDEQPKVINQQMEDTRAALTEKLEALESRVADTVQTTTDVVQTATEAVSETVENVKETVEAVTESVQETVQSVGDVFNVSQHVERHPWLVFGGAVAVGCLAGWALAPRRRRHSGAMPMAALQTTPAEQPNGSGASRPEPPKPAPSPTSTTTGWVSEQLGRLKNLALGSLMGVVRDLASRSVPGALGGRLAEEVDTMTERMGAEPIRGPVLGEEKPAPPSGRQTPATAGAGRN
jgi:ElaB/YqjD/DUF883 family membrane-anchored ribosome-binding protein